MTELRLCHLEHFVIKSGDLKNYPAYCVDVFANDKKKKLRIGQTTLRTDEGFNRIVDDPDDDWSTYKLLHHYITHHLSPNYDGVLFVRRAPGKVLKLRQALGQMYEGNTELSNPAADGSRTFLGKLGKNAPSKLFKEFAARCGFDNPEKCTGRAP
jgi:hypothetical protein